MIRVAATAVLAVLVAGLAAQAIVPYDGIGFGDPLPFIVMAFIAGFNAVAVLGFGRESLGLPRFGLVGLWLMLAGAASALLYAGTPLWAPLVLPPSEGIFDAHHRLDLVDGTLYPAVLLGAVALVLGWVSLFVSHLLTMDRTG